MIHLETAGHGVIEPRSGSAAGHAPPLDVPERPALAPNVQLVGEMPGTSFTDRQWLVQCHGHFIQLTELLYRAVEQVNGDRTLDEIARRVTDSTDWDVTAADLRQLLRTKLIPAGLVTGTDGRAASRGPSSRDGASPLAIKLRFRLAGPRAIRPITTVLQFLFAPPLAVPVLIALTMAHAWLYFEHDVARSVGAALYIPGGLLVVLAIMLASSVFHEFGHASALRYGGGHAREIGGGLYFVFPALYTDVTDSYRLGRWARVRTALGGVYFHLICAAGLIALYWVSGYELLLFVVLLINLDVLRQFIPFVRLDGYWLLADLTGIPDFHSQMRPFLRSVLPIPGWNGSKLPRLKPWAAKVFFGYIIFAIPALAILLVLTVTGLPAVVAVTWDALFHQAAVLTSARNSDDVLRMSTAVTSMVLLVLPVFATCYFLCSVARKPFRKLWEWAATPGRRLVAALGTSGSIALLVGGLWIPALPPAGVTRFAIEERWNAARWQNCGYYDTPIVIEHAIGSLARGAVWIMYRPDLPQAQRDVLRQLASRESLVLASPYPALPVPVVAFAWGRVMPLHSAEDPRLRRFVRVFQNGLQAPERGAPCAAGVGVPR
jgi:putative peptide zinc metalloprotease protein